MYLLTIRLLDEIDLEHRGMISYWELYKRFLINFNFELLCKSKDNVIFRNLYAFCEDYISSTN